MNIYKSEKSFGNNLVNAKKSLFCYNLKNSEDCKYWIFGDTGKNAQDLTVGGELEWCYEGIVPDHSHTACFTIFCWSCHDVRYSEMCHHCEHCFGCVGLKHKKYCILNKEYSREEYETLVPKIIESMMKTGDWGEFFPASLSPFEYNETIASDYYPLNSRPVSGSGYSIPKNITILSYDKNRSDEEILKNAFQCEKSGRLFRLIADELKFYHRFNLPLPRLHPDERIKKRISLMPEKELYLYKDKNGSEFISVFNPEEYNNVVENKM